MAIFPAFLPHSAAFRDKDTNSAIISRRQALHSFGTKRHQHLILKGSIKAMPEIFPPARFIRVHSSFIVSVQKITRLEKNRIIPGSYQIPIGRNFREAIEKVLK
jgi:DNA-binding LytR/AlgR family response regulator